MLQATRAPLPVADAALAEVERLGVSRNDFLLHALCVVLDMPEYDPLAHVDKQSGEQMQMTA